jgi:hypothetical protein
MRFYPEVSDQLAGTIARDVLALVLLAVFAWLGLAVHDAVDDLAVLGRGVHDTGSAVQSGFEGAADAVEGTPAVGEDLAEGLRGAGEGSGGRVADLGRRGEERVHRLADLLGFLTFALPAALTLLQHVPGRIRQIRRLTAAERVLRQPDSPERRRLLAMRAAFSLPYGRLLEYTRDPLGDLADERYDGLVAAALEDAGLRARNSATATAVSS